MMFNMRTTLTIDDNLAAALKKRAFETGKSFKATVNETLARGLMSETLKPARRKKVNTSSVSLGRPRMDLTSATRLAGELEDEELVRKMDQRK